MSSKASSSSSIIDRPISASSNPSSWDLSRRLDSSRTIQSVRSNVDNRSKLEEDLSTVSGSPSRARRMMNRLPFFRQDHQKTSISSMPGNKRSRRASMNRNAVNIQNISAKLHSKRSMQRRASTGAATSEKGSDCTSSEKVTPPLDTVKSTRWTKGSGRRLSLGLNGVSNSPQ
jgi:hypothetical protein